MIAKTFEISLFFLLVSYITEQHKSVIQISEFNCSGIEP